MRVTTDIPPVWLIVLSDEGGKLRVSVDQGALEDIGRAIRSGREIEVAPDSFVEKTSRRLRLGLIQPHLVPPSWQAGDAAFSCTLSETLAVENATRTRAERSAGGLGFGSSADMRERDRVGTARYGTCLQPHNGRDALRDAYEEVLDLAVYLRQALFERGGS